MALVVKEGSVLQERYLIHSRLGTGAFGIVWRAHDQKLRRDVAIKRIIAGSSALEEGQKVSKLNHANVVHVYEVLELDGDSFLIMEYVPGVSLDQFLMSIRDEWLGETQAISIIGDCLEGLSHAHDNGVVHRDLKPGNIMFSDELETAKLMDFGLAKHKTGEPEETQSQSVFGAKSGTPSYMSPEQAMGDRLDKSTDVFSLGIVAHLLLTKRHPYIDLTGLESTFDLIKSDEFEPEPTRRINAKITHALGDVIDRMLEKRRENRFSDAREAYEAFKLATSRVRNCHACGNENDESNNFCGACGEKLLTFDDISSGLTADSDAEALTKEGFALANQYKWVDAIKKYKDAVEADSTYALAYANWGYALNHLGHHKEAIEVLTKAIEISEHFACYDYRGFAYSKLRENEKALADFDKAIEDQPNRIGFRLHRIHVLFYMERYSDAYEDVIQVLKRDPQNTKALHFKSRIEKHIGGLGL